MKNTQGAFHAAGEEVGACGGLFGTSPSPRRLAKAFTHISGKDSLAPMNDIARAATSDAIAESLEGVLNKGVYVTAFVEAQAKGLDQGKHEPTRGVIHMRPAASAYTPL